MKIEWNGQNERGRNFLSYDGLEYEGFIIRSVSFSMSKLDKRVNIRIREFGEIQSI